jgi:hypothetical protein
MTYWKWTIALAMIAAVLGPGRPGYPQDSPQTRAAHALADDVARAPGRREAIPFVLADRQILRAVSTAGGRLATTRVGRPGRESPVTGGDEFAVILGPDRRRVAAGEFQIRSAEPAPGELRFVLQHPQTGLRAEAEYLLATDDGCLRKTIRFRNDGSAAIQILDVEVESLRFGKARALGLGKPVYVDDRLFLGLEFPLGRNRQEDGLVTLGHLPGKTLQPGESLATRTAVTGAAADGETVERAFDRYVRRIALRKPELMTVYGNWARYDYLSDGVWPDEKMVLETTGELRRMRAAGWQPDYYVMDAGWFDGKGDYTAYARPAWPNGPATMVKAIADVGARYGLWFDVGGGIPDNPAVQASRKPDGRLCLAEGAYISAFKRALVRQIEDLGLTMVKFDFATFDCGSDRHGHLQGEYAVEASLARFLEMLDEVRKDHPQVRYIIFNGFHRSPWWLMHVDTIYCSDPAPSDTPSLRFRDSINLRTDMTVREHRLEHLLPWYAIDDCGLMIGRTGTIYWIGAEEIRKTWMLNLGRGGLMPFIYGDLRLLGESDRRFIAEMWEVLRQNTDAFADTRTILGQANGAEVYGYSHFRGEHGFVFLSNPTFEPKPAVLKLDESLGLAGPAQSPLRVSELFPTACLYAAPGGTVFQPRGEVQIELAPFEVRALEVKPSQEAVTGAVPPRGSRYGSIAIPVRLTARGPEWLSDTDIGRANRQRSHLASSTTAKTDKNVDVSRSGLKGVQSLSIALPAFDGSRTLAMPFRFLAGGRPVRNNHPTECVLAVAWSGDRQVLLDMTPEYGRPVWSGCSWITCHARLDASLSGATLEVMVLNLGLEGAAVHIDTSYVLNDLPQP